MFSEFKKHLELYVPSLYDRLLLILHRFYFNSNCDHLLGDLNYTYRQLKKILPNENLFKDMKNTLKSTCIDEDELVRTYDLVCDLKTFCETRKDINLLKLRAVHEESRRKFRKVLKKDIILSCSYPRFQKNYQSFLSHSKQRLDEVTVLQRRIQDDIKSSAFNVKTILEFCQCFIDAFENNKSAFYI